MAEEALKLDASPVVMPLLALATKGYQKLAQALGQLQAADKISAVEAQYSAKKDMVLAVVGLVLILYGAQFKSMLLCTQVVLAFLFDRIKGAVMQMHGEVQVAVEKMKADEPAAPEPVAKEVDEDKSKHAKKRDAKKNAAATNGRSSVDASKADADAAKKVLKVLDHEKLSSAATQVLASVMACILVLHSGFAQKVAIAISLVGLVVDKVDAVLDFPEYESLESWTCLMVRIALYAVIFPLTLVAAPLALAMNAAALGAKLAIEHGCHVAEQFKRLEKADEFISSKRGFLAACGVTAFGTLWQFWSWAAGSEMAWYVQLPLLPAVLIEGVLKLL